MDKNLTNKTDQTYSDALQKFKSEPPGELWNKIESRLDEEDKKIALFRFGWKQYAAAALLLIAVLGILDKFYFHQDVISGPNSKLHGEVKNHMVIPPKMGIPYDGQNMKPDFSNDNRKDKTAGTARDVGEEEVLSDSNRIRVKTISAQPIVSPLSLVPVRQSELPSAEIDNKTLSVIHQKTPFKNRLSVTSYFSQEFAGYNFTDNDLTGLNGQEIEQRERNVFSASFGFYFNYLFSKHWVLQSGISYSWSNSQIDSATSYAVKDNQGNVQYKLNTISGYGYLHSPSPIQPNVGDSVSTAKSYSQLHYLTVPLILSYRVPLKKFSLLIGAGAYINMLTSAEIETRAYGNNSPEREYSVDMMGLKKINYGMILKLDLEYRIHSRMGVNLMTSFKNSLSPINLESTVTAYPYNFGIAAGITYRF